MSKYKNNIFWLIVFIAISSCTKEEIVDDKQYSHESNITLKSIESLGFDIDKAQDFGNYYLVGDDIIFYKGKDYSASIGDGDGVKTEQTRTFNLVAQDKSLNIRVKTDIALMNSGSDFWGQAIQLAILDWNRISNCRLTFDSDSRNPDIIVRPDNGVLPDFVIAAAEWPSNGRPGREIIVNLDFLNNSVVSELSKRYNMVHELGHTVGFRHTNWVALGEGTGSVGAIQIPGTPLTDALSVMNGGTANFNWVGFSSGDQQGARAIYPQPNAINNWIISPNGGETFGSPFFQGGGVYGNIRVRLNTSLRNANRVYVGLYCGENAFAGNTFVDYGIVNVVNGELNIGPLLPISNQVLVKITDVDNPNFFDFSDNRFMVRGPQ